MTTYGDDLEEHQFEILALDTNSSGYRFGLGMPVSINEDGLDTGETTWLTQRGQNSRRGVTSFGRDVTQGNTWAFTGIVDQEDLASALSTLEDISAAWMPDDEVRQPGNICALRYKVAGRTRRILGRPGRFAGPPTNLIMNGRVDVDFEFETIDPFHYDDEQTQQIFQFNSLASPSGITFPVTFPIQTNPGSSTDGLGSLYIGGNARCYPIIRLCGPWVNPTFQTDDWSVSWSGSIPANDWVEIDTRPWKLSVTRKSGASAIEGLGRRVWLEDMWFAPKSKPQVRLGGYSASGGAMAVISWRNAWTSL